MAIGNAITLLRRRHQMEQKQLADALKISVGYLSQVENDRRKPSIKLLANIADVFKIPLSALLLLVLEEKHFADENKKELLRMAKPVIEDLIDLFSEPGIEQQAPVKQTRLSKTNSRLKLKT